MSKVIPRVEHLVRAALTSIIANPQTWDQEEWVKTPEHHVLADKPVPECGTTYCLGGWMMLYDGWKHASSVSWGWVGSTDWIKGDMKEINPFDYLRTLIPPYHHFGDAGDTIFDQYYDTIDKLISKVEEDLEINFEEECPCLTEDEACNLQGCPCGTHTAALKNTPTVPAVVEDVMLKIVEAYVSASRQAGRPITVAKVLSDEISMNALRAAFTAGEMSLINKVTAKADRRVSEVRNELAAMTASRDRVVARNSELQQAHVQKLSEQIELSRKLQGWVDDLRSGAKQTLEFRKLVAKCRRLEESNQALTLVNKSLALQNRTFRQQGIQETVNAVRAVLDRYTFDKKEEGV